MALKKNLIFFCYIADIDNINEVTLFHIRALKIFNSLFDGDIIIYLSTDDMNISLWKVNCLFDFFGKTPTIKIVRNHPHNRESEYFIESLKDITNTDSLTFYSHNKGSTHSLDYTLKNWIFSMYFFNLIEDNMKTMTSKLSEGDNYIFSGCLKKNGIIPGIIESEWHYSGAFFWFNTSKLFDLENWDHMVKDRMALESYPGKMVKTEKALSVFIEENYNYHMNDELFYSNINIDSIGLSQFEFYTYLIQTKN